MEQLNLLDYFLALINVILWIFVLIDYNRYLSLQIVGLTEAIRILVLLRIIYYKNNKKDV